MLTKERLWLLNWGWLINWIMTGMAALLLIIVIACTYFYSANVRKQQEVNDRQTFLQQSAIFDRALNDIAQGLIKLQSETGDKDIAELLDRNGITLKPRGTAPMPEQTPASPKTKP
jgi:transcriptional regulatory protein LevR